MKSIYNSQQLNKTNTTGKLIRAFKRITLYILCNILCYSHHTQNVTAQKLLKHKNLL